MRRILARAPDVSALVVLELLVERNALSTFDHHDQPLVHEMSWVECQEHWRTSYFVTKSTFVETAYVENVEHVETPYEEQSGVSPVPLEC